MRDILQWYIYLARQDLNGTLRGVDDKVASRFLTPPASRICPLVASKYATTDGELQLTEQ